MAGKDEEAFFNVIRSNTGIRDPLTGLQPEHEVELTAALACAMSSKDRRADVRWDACRGIPDGEGIASDFQRALNEAHIVLTEHPLFAGTTDEIGKWGAMRADVIVASGDFRTVILIESKVDSEFTFGNEWPSGQMARYAQYLERMVKADSGRKALLLLVTPCWNADWYLKRYTKLINDAKEVPDVSFAHVTWEALFGLNEG